MQFGELGSGSFKTFITPDKQADTLQINQQAWFSIGSFSPGTRAVYEPHGAGHGLYFFLIDGETEIGADILRRRDALAITQAGQTELVIKAATKVLVIEVASF